MRLVHAHALAWVLFAIGAAAPALADGVQVVLRGSRVESVQAGSTQLHATQLESGLSSGDVELSQLGFGVGAADDRNLATYFARQNVGPYLEVDLGTWTDRGAGYDFFLFEVGGNDTVRVRPRFSDGSLGKPTALSGWTPTGYAVPTGPNDGQETFGLAFASDQLLDAAGVPLPIGARLAGLQFESATFDVASFLAHVSDPTAGIDGDGSVVVAGANTAGQLLELHYEGPWASETDIDPNPFRDYQLSVTFKSPTGSSVDVPGFFDADGAGGEWGTRWVARFRPPAPGVWRAKASFLMGTDVAVDDAVTGSPGILNGVQVSFQVGPIDSQAPGFLRWGTLRYVGEHYLKFDTGPYFLEVGVNSPENILAFRGFDAVTKMPESDGVLGVLHSFGPHIPDSTQGDPYFFSRDHMVSSRGIIGALNYLSEVGQNSIYALTMNLGGDGKDVHPFVGLESTAFDRNRYDTSRLAQWNTVLEHAAQRGILVRMVLGETETPNEEWLDGGAFGLERRLFLRELVARFSHLPAVVWVLCEESDWSQVELREMADWIRSLDPFQHSVTFHNHINDFSDYEAVLGEERFEQTAIQYTVGEVADLVEKWREKSVAAGHPWVVAAVENTPWNVGLTDQNQDELRKRILYDGLFSGGSLQWYMGWHDLPLGGDLTLEDFRTRSQMWEYSRHATELLRSYPFQDMQPLDAAVTGEAGDHGGAEVFHLPGEVYLIYLPRASGAAQLDLTGVNGTFLQRWFDPRTGEWVGAAQPVSAGGPLAIGLPPHSKDEDWVCLVEWSGHRDPVWNCAPLTYCSPADGSMDNRSLVQASSCALDDSVTINLSSGPPNQFCYLLIGDGAGVVSDPPGAQGDLCLAGGLLRRYVKDLGKITAGGTFMTDISNSQTGGPGYGIPNSAGQSIQPGETWNFQYWHRQPGGQPSSFSAALSVRFN